MVTFTGAGVTATVGHGLGVAPKMFIIKNRSAVIEWFVYTTVIDGSLDFLYLNTTDAKQDSGVSLPTSSVFSVNSSTAPNTNNIVAYCFAEVEGYSKFGSFVANGSADGTFAYTGFRPAFVLWKNTSATGSWNTFDTSRSPYNAVDEYLRPNTSDAESSGTDIIDLLSNGFKTRYALTNGNTYIYMAFAANPFKNSLAR